jgi:rhodanese-related sulfurtransferase
MRKLILMTFLAAPLLVHSAACAQSDATSHGATKAPPVKAKTLTRAELDELLAQPDKVLLIDVRRPSEIATIGGFPVYLSIQIGELAKHLDAIPRDRIIVTVSNHAARAGHAADLLASKGFNVAGAVGAETYQSEGGTLAKVVDPKAIATSDKEGHQ